MSGIPKRVVNAAAAARMTMSSSPADDAAQTDETNAGPADAAHQSSECPNCAQLELRLKNMRAARDGRLVKAEERIASLEGQIANRPAQQPAVSDVETVVDPAPAPQQQVQVDPAAPSANDVAFFKALDQKRPDWQSYNSRQAFLNWLGEVEPVDGLARQDIMDGYIGSHDLDGLIGMLDQFDALQSPASTSSPTPHPSQQGGSQALASDGSAHEELVEWWPQSEVQAVMKRKDYLRQRGQLSMTHPEGKKVLEQELSIRKAIANNRVLVGQ